MCDWAEHLCLVCKKMYECDVPNQDCDTLNSDDDGGNLCPQCIKSFDGKLWEWMNEDGKVN